MAMIPVPSRIFKQISTWVMLGMVLADSAHALLSSLADLHVVTTTQLGVANAVMGFVAMASKLIQQNIALTPDQKDTMHEAIENAPVKPEKTPPPPVTIPAPPPTP